MKEFIFNRGGSKQKIRANRIGTDIWLHLNGETWVISQKPKSKSADKGSADTFTGEILAPMPGKILKINATVGDSVAANKVLIIMEAMKMEYTLATPQPGIVSELNCKEGQQVELHQKLAFVKVLGEK